MLFIEKGRDIVGLYVNLPDRALLLCMVEKTRTKTGDQILESRAVLSPDP